MVRTLDLRFCGRCDGHYLGLAADLQADVSRRDLAHLDSDRIDDGLFKIRRRYFHLVGARLQLQDAEITVLIGSDCLGGVRRSVANDDGSVLDDRSLRISYRSLDRTERILCIKLG